MPMWESREQAVVFRIFPRHFSNRGKKEPIKAPKPCRKVSQWGQEDTDSRLYSTSVSMHQISSGGFGFSNQQWRVQVTRPFAQEVIVPESTLSERECVQTCANVCVWLQVCVCVNYVSFLLLTLPVNSQWARHSAELRQHAQVSDTQTLPHACTITGIQNDSFNHPSYHSATTQSSPLQLLLPDQQ